MATAYTVFDSTPATVVADIKAKILLSSDWTNITGNIVKATTTRGAQMVVDLADAAANSNRMQLAVYRTHDGTTGVDKLTRYITYNNQTPATSTVLHCMVSAGKEHLVITVMGPRVGETGAQEISTYGSPKASLALCDIVPYHASDTTPAVMLAAHQNSGIGDVTDHVWVSRDQTNTLSWVKAYVYSLTRPAHFNSIGVHYNVTQPLSRGDSKIYVWPFVVVEVVDGLRGRLNKIHYVGMNGGPAGPDDGSPPFAGTRVTYSSEGYIYTAITRGYNGGSYANGLSFSFQANSFATTTGPSDTGNSTIVAIPDGT